MPKATIISACFLLFFHLSCKTLISKKFHFNEDFRFRTAPEYLAYLETNKKIDPRNVLYPDSTEAENLMTYIYNNKLTIFYGTILNDSLEVRKSAELQDNLSCMGRVLTDLENAITQKPFNDTSLYVKSDFGKFKFRRALTRDKFNASSDPAPMKIILLYSYSYGTYFDPLLEEMRKFALDNAGKAEVYIISLDYIYHFK